MSTNETIVALAARFSKAFSVYERRRRPLKLGIHHDIVAAAPDILMKELHAALSCYVNNVGYLYACKAGAARIDLNGKPVGCVTEDEAKNRRDKDRVTPDRAIETGEHDGTEAARAC
jgi:ProP effector